MAAASAQRANVRIGVHGQAAEFQCGNKVEAQSNF